MRFRIFKRDPQTASKLEERWAVKIGFKGELELFYTFNQALEWVQQYV
jgi:hypothetical protein